MRNKLLLFSYEMHLWSLASAHEMTSSSISKWEMSVHPTKSHSKVLIILLLSIIILERIKRLLSWIVILLMILLKILNQNLMVRMNIQILVFLVSLICTILLPSRCVSSRLASLLATSWGHIASTILVNLSHRLICVNNWRNYQTIHIFLRIVLNVFILVTFSIIWSFSLFLL